MKAENKKKKSKKILLIIIASIILLTLLATAWFFFSLPDVSSLKTKNPTMTALMEQRKKEAQVEKKKLKIYHKWVKFSVIPKILKDTVRISEDAGFYYHDGIDYHELEEAIKINLKKGKKVRGASTITQQLAKNLYLSTDKSYFRKIKEFFIAKKLEKNLSKDRIFCLYLNVIEFGKGIFGVGAASQYFFHKPVQDLNLIEIIRLVSVIPKPLRVSPLSSSRYMKWRYNFLLTKLYKYKFISERDYKKAAPRNGAL